jgi:hypothetical protein
MVVSINKKNNTTRKEELDILAALLIGLEALSPSDLPKGAVPLIR